MVHKPATFFGEKPEVAMEYPNHAVLESTVAHKIAVSGGIDASDVTVRAEGSTITLLGTVGSAEQVERAEVVARSVEGVSQVENSLLVKKAPSAGGV